MANGNHTHDDNEQLVFGCPACIAIRHDAEWAAAPLHDTTWEWWTVDGKSGTFHVTTQVLSTASLQTLSKRAYARPEVIDALNAITDLPEDAYWECIQIGEQTEAAPKGEA